MKISFRNDINKNYMVIENVKDFSPDNFGIKMQVHNRIPGLTALEWEQIDGKTNVLYDISRRQSFATRFGGVKMSFDEIKALILALNDVTKTLGEYLLNPDNLMIKRECIFLGTEREDYAFCYFPYYGGNLGLEVRELLRSILSDIDYNDAHAVQLAYSLQREAASDNYTLEALLDVVEETIAAGAYEGIRPYGAGEPGTRNEGPSRPDEIVDDDISWESYGEARVGAPREGRVSERMSYDNDAEYMREEDDELTFSQKAKIYFKDKSFEEVFDDINKARIIRKIKSVCREDDGEYVDSMYGPARAEQNQTASQYSGDYSGWDE